MSGVGCQVLDAGYWVLDEKTASFCEGDRFFAKATGCLEGSGFRKKLGVRIFAFLEVG